MPLEKTPARHSLRIAAIGDIHVSKTSQGQFQQLFAQIGSNADVLVLCGDFTDYGLRMKRAFSRVSSARR
jgi:Icc-related predicted phosphoesterase